MSAGGLRVTVAFLCGAVPIELYCIFARGRALPAVVAGFNTFLKGYIAGWVNSRNGALLA